MSNFDLMVRLDEIELIASLLIGCINDNDNTSNELKNINDGLKLLRLKLLAAQSVLENRALLLDG